jgi:hypothetical protein
MQKVAEKYGVCHITAGEREEKMTMQISNLPEKMMAQRMMMNKNEIK